MNALEQYISRATRGLYGAKKLEIQAELRGSIEARIWQLERQGCTNALETALLEMGESKTINSGLIKEHLMPNISKAIFVFIAVITLTIAGLSSSHAQVGWAAPRDNPSFLNPNCSCNFYMSLNDLKRSLEKAGATVTETMSQPLPHNTRQFMVLQNPRVTVQYFNNSNLEWDKNLLVRTLSIQFQSGKKTHQIQLQALSGYSLNEQEKMAMKPEEATFVAFDYVVERFKTTKLPIRFEGWQRPKIQLGDFGFTLERPNTPFDATSIYGQLFTDWVFKKEQRVSQYSNPINIIYKNQGYYPFRHAVRINAPANTVFALLTTQGGFTIPKGGGAAQSYLTILRANDQGILEFRSLFEYLEFSKSRDVIKATDAKQLNTGTVERPARALLYKFTGRLDDAAKPVEIVLPSKTKIAAIK